MEGSDCGRQAGTRKEGTFTSPTLSLSFLRSFGVATAICNVESMSSYMYVHGNHPNGLRLRRRHRIPRTPNGFLLSAIIPRLCTLR